MNLMHRIQSYPLMREIGVSLVMLLVLLLSGCAGKPWSSPIADHETAAIALIFENMQRRDASCFASMDAKVLLTWEGPGGAHSLSGYLQLLLPSSMKFVVSNPLGQPVYALVSNGQEFQSINTALKQHVIGQLGSLARDHDVPEALLSAHWGYWLTGRLWEEGAVIDAMHQDDSGRGVWITLRYPITKEPSDMTGVTNYLLINPGRQQLLARMLVDDKGETVATISYEEREKGEELVRQEWERGCAPATRIIITDLPYRSLLTLHFSEIVTDRSFSANTFRLKIPAGYTTAE